jgi:hypothetical protein
MTRTTLSSPHSGQGRGSEISVAFARDEDIENIQFLFFKDLAFSIDIQAVKS